MKKISAALARIRELAGLRARRPDTKATASETGTTPFVVPIDPLLLPGKSSGAKSLLPERSRGAKPETGSLLDKSGSIASDLVRVWPQGEPVRQRAPAHLLEDAARLAGTASGGSSGTLQKTPGGSADKQQVTQVATDPQAVTRSEVLVGRSPGRALHMVVRDADREHLLISWHNDTDKAIEWRIASHHMADAVRRVFLSVAFPGCSFTISAQLLDELPAEAQDMVRDAITTGVVSRPGGQSWRFDGTVILLTEDAEGCRPLDSFDCFNERPEMREARFAALRK